MNSTKINKSNSIKEIESYRISRIEQTTTSLHLTQSECHKSRASDNFNSINKAIIGSCAVNQSIPEDTWKNILQFCNILMFRLVSKSFKNLISSTKLFQEKADLVFFMKNSYRIDSHQVQDLIKKVAARIDFAIKEKLTVKYCIHLSIASPKEEIKEILNALNIILDIESHEIQSLQVKLENHFKDPFKNHNFTKFLEKIQNFNFFNMPGYGSPYCDTYTYDSKIKKLLSVIENNIQFFPNLKTLRLTITIENYLNKFPNLCKQITSFSGANEFIKSLKAPNLKYLQLYNLSLISNTMFAIKHEQLIGLQIDKIVTEPKTTFLNNLYYQDCSLNLFLPNLRKLQIFNNSIQDDQYCMGCNISFYNSHLPNLLELDIGIIKEKSCLYFPPFPLLNSLGLSKCSEGSKAEFKELTNLQHLILGEINSNFQLHGALPNLSTLELSSLNNIVIEKLPKSLPKVEKVLIKKLNRTTFNRTINFSTSFGLLNTLTIPSLYTETILNISGSMPCLQTLTIGNLHEKSSITIDLSKLKELENLNIGDIHQNCTIHLIGSNNNLKSLSFGVLNQKSLNYLGGDESSIIIESKDALNNLTRLEIKKYCCHTKFNFNLPNTLPDFSIEPKFNFNLPDYLPNLKELIFEGVSLQVKVFGDIKEFRQPLHHNVNYDLLNAINKRINRL